MFEVRGSVAGIFGLEEQHCVLSNYSAVDQECLTLPLFYGHPLQSLFAGHGSVSSERSTIAKLFPELSFY